MAPLARKADETGEFPLHLIGRMAELGFLGGPIATGVRRRGDGRCLVRAGLRRVGAGRFVGARALDGACEPRRRLHRAVGNSGAESSAICPGYQRRVDRLLLPHGAEAGSDAANIQTTATADGDDYLLEWRENLDHQRQHGAPGHRLCDRDRAERHKGICAFLVETDTPGMRREEMPGVELGHRASDHAHITFEDCRVPASAMLGEPGEGFKIAMSALDRGRLGVAAGAVGIGQACLDACVLWARERRQFGRRLGDFQMVQATIANMAADIAAARLLVYHAAWLVDAGRPATQAVSSAKLFATEAAARAASEAVLLYGNRGYSSEYPVERYYRDIKGLQIYEGASNIQRIILARELIGREQ